MKKMTKRIIAVLISLTFLLGLCVIPISAEERKANLDYYIVQSDPQWADVKVGTLTIAQSACGICGICNAVYYLTGKKLDLVKTAEWAHQKGYFNTDSVAGCYRSVFKHSTKEYGELCGYTATEFLYNSIRANELISHIKAGGTAVLHVSGHFMTLIDYNEKDQTYLVIDSMPGDVGKYDNRRKGITHLGGDWLTAETLSTGTTKVDGYSLFSRALTKDETNAAVNASLLGLKL